MLTPEKPAGTSSSNIPMTTPRESATGTPMSETTMPITSPPLTPSISPLKPTRFVSERVYERFFKLRQRVPLFKAIVDKLSKLPVRARLALFGLWVVWKVVISVLLLFFVVSKSSSSSSADEDPAAAFANASSSMVAPTGNVTQPIKLLYIVTSLAEFNNGKRQTVKGQDRLKEVMMPVIVDSLESLLSFNNYQVDLYLILAYELRPDREAYIRSQLPPHVGLEVWDDACPLGYDVKGRLGPDHILDNTRALARQHRYVIKDKLWYYDLFLAFEDDMRLTGDHASHFLHMSYQIDQLRYAAPETTQGVPESMDAYQQRFHGSLTRGQLDRVLPGFIRVEVLLNETEHGAQTTLDPIPLDYTFPISDNDDSSGMEERHFNPQICCHVHMNPNIETPVHPAISDVIIWETNIKAFSARQMPKLGASGKVDTAMEWVGVLPGPGKKQAEETKMGGYWSGRNHEFGDEEKPSGGRPDIIGQQGGWMLTTLQIVRLNKGLCMGSFLPPFELPAYHENGQESKNVEYWSGGYQLFTGVAGGCNMQRIMSLHPDHFSKHFIYHVANNKQKQLNQERMLRADHYFGQINTVKKLAEKAVAAETQTGDEQGNVV